MKSITRRTAKCSNRAFKESELLDQIQLNEGNWLSSYSKDDQYSKAKLAARSRYHNAVRLRFQQIDDPVHIGLQSNLGLRRFIDAQTRQIDGDTRVTKPAKSGYELMPAPCPMRGAMDQYEGSHDGWLHEAR